MFISTNKWFSHFTFYCVYYRKYMYSLHIWIYIRLNNILCQWCQSLTLYKNTVICNFSEFIVSKTLTWIIFCVYILQKSDQIYQKKNVPVKLFQILESLRIKICRRACPGRVEGLIPEGEGTDPKKQSIELSPTDASSLTLPPSRTWRWPVA